ncbi:MAG: GHKL domain-containing protein, partial [Oscillospiraceae bacterium]|nr:GHKL domain-containing protein [Oscillospiraceae bacterium]
ERFIKIMTKIRGDLLFIELENSFDGKPFEIGMGIENIIAAAEKYGGTAQISTHGDMFSLKMILCNSQH